MVPRKILRRVLQRTGGVDFALRRFPPVVHDKVHVHGLLFLAQIPDARREARAIAVQLELAVAVDIAAAQQDLDQLYLTAFVRTRRSFPDGAASPVPGILNLHEPHLCVLFNVERRAHEQALLPSQRFKHRRFAPAAAWTVDASCGLAASRCISISAFSADSSLQHDRRAFVPVNRCFIHAQTIPRPAGQLVDGHFLH